MDELIRGMIDKDLVSVEPASLDDLKEAVNRLLAIRDYVDLLTTSRIFNEPPEWWSIRNYLRRN